MEERNSRKAYDHAKRSCRGGAAPFFVGIVAALIVGWWLFPQVLYSKKVQPIRFSHTVHMEDAGMACEDCHYFQEDGSYNGLPTTEDCAQCHSDLDSIQGEDPEEKKFIEEYVLTGKEVEWYVYQKQPDNAFFSHAVHSKATCIDMGCHSEVFQEENERELCNQCHPDLSENDTPPVFYENRLSGYSKMTMKMWQCEECHANENHIHDTNANNACHVCHK